MDSIFVDVRSADGRNLCFIERPRNFLGCLIVKVRKVLDEEVGDLLPRSYKFCRRGIPVSSKQEQNLELNACVRTVAPVEVDQNEDTCAVTSDYSLEIKEFAIEDSMESTKVMPALINRSPIAGAAACVKSTLPTRSPNGIRERVESRGVEKSLLKIAEDKEALIYKLDIAKANLISLKEDVPEQKPIGSIRSAVCSSCHIRGHRVNKPCTLPPCQSYFDCGMLNLHREHKAKIQEVNLDYLPCEKMMS